ncbi:MAG: aldo/keto reductase [Acidobacteriota bacterium]|jgi:aryl-alcohol dehydrogenase-like predicted oxidoreductase
MRSRVLGTTGYEVSEVGFGAWGLGGTMWLGVDEDEGAAALAEALRLGVTLVDTALAYGSGTSERIVARVLDQEDARDRVVVATKVPPRNNVWPGDGRRPLRDAFPAEHVVACVEKSLRMLDTPALQIEQLHVWHDAWLDDPEWPDTRAAMVELKEQGKVLHWGVSINDHAPETALQVLRDPLFETAQVIYNIYDRTPERELFELARDKPLGVIVRVPFDEGALTGAIGADTVFPPGDWRERYFSGDRRAEAGHRAEALAELLGGEVETLPELALRFCLSRPEVSTVIPGMRRIAHARANAAVSDGRHLTDALLTRLAEHAWDKNWYSQD